ncbi:SAM-dependent methyltransferase [bacterium]|nr:SAM-dependent methyltransferase [bacterium]
MWRPSPVGVTTCRLIARKGNILVVEGLDAINGTTVFDIKPFWLKYDSINIEQYKCPSWVDKLEF